MASRESQELIAEIRAQPRMPFQDVEQLRASFVAMSERFPPPPDAVFERINAGGVPAEWSLCLAAIHHVCCSISMAAAMCSVPHPS
jgi:hypothetical protein